MTRNLMRYQNKRPFLEIEPRAVIHFLWEKPHRNPDVLSELEDA
jgi:hypothetical protein